jgi:hypothetical protein
MDPESRVVFAAQEMEKVHPVLPDNLEGSFTKVWPADPWAGGAGSHTAPGQLTTLCAGLEQPEGGSILPANTYPHGLIGCRELYNPGCEQLRKCRRRMSRVDETATRKLC